jgi:mannose-6-phosphate isomerase-like protein (cupin superfamily)
VCQKLAGEMAVVTDGNSGTACNVRSRRSPKEVSMSFSHDGIILGNGEGKTIQVLGGSYTYKAAKEETGGAYALIEGTIAGDGPPAHIHKAEEEAFYVLEGELNVLIGERRVQATHGTFVLVPRGTVHTFAKTGRGSAKILIIISPAGFEKFFEEIAGPPELEKIRALASKYNLEIVGPPLEHSGT